MYFFLLTLWALSHAIEEPWLIVDSSIKLQLDSAELKSAFRGNEISMIALVEERLEKSPVFETVVQHFSFKSNTAIKLELQDAFCAGQTYSVWLNGLWLAQDFPDLPTICGVSTGSLSIIYSPQFMRADYYIPAGQNSLFIIIKGSRIGNKVTSMRITMLPVGPIDPGTPATISMAKAYKKIHYVDGGFDINDFARNQT